jgi:hypothetical protein
MQGFDLTLSLYNYDKFKNELKEFDPKLRRAMDKEIRNVLQPIANTARGLVPDQPLSGWRYGDERYTPSRLPYWNPSTARKGIVVKQGGKRKSGFAEQAAWRISNLDGAGVAFELAGRKKKNVLSESLLSANLGKPRRLVWRAWYEAKGWKLANQNIREIIKFYEVELQRKFDTNSNAD